MAFLLGYATGPVKGRCPPGATGWRRFGLATGAILYHELAILAGALALLALSWGQANQVGLQTYLLLWGMRQSAKLNIFLGARNLNEQFLPGHLRHIGSYFAHKPMNLLFPVSVTAGTLLCALLFHRAFAVGADDFTAAGFTFLGVLAVLGVLEHWFLVLPIPAEALWNWGMRSRAAPATLPEPVPAAVVDPRPRPAARPLALATSSLGLAGLGEGT
jgi:putative photosynthetic complex assembly protein 2